MHQAGKTAIPLAAVARIVEVEGPAEIRRAEGERVAVVTANLVGRDLASAGTSDAPRIAQAAEEALAHLGRGAADLAAADERETDTKRQHVRVLLSDVLRVLCVEARERAADRPSPMLPAVTPEDALDHLARWGELEAAVAANVTPAAILIDAAGALRDGMRIR